MPDSGMNDQSVNCRTLTPFPRPLSTTLNFKFQPRNRQFFDQRPKIVWILSLYCLASKITQLTIFSLFKRQFMN